MSRKRKSDKESTETATATETAAPAESATAVAEPPAAEAQPEGRSFADKVGKKKYVPDPDPFGIATDKAAGVRLFQSKQDRQMAIKFGDGRPKEITKPGRHRQDERGRLPVGHGDIGYGHIRSGPSPP